MVHVLSALLGMSDVRCRQDKDCQKAAELEAWLAGSKREPKAEFAECASRHVRDV
jgi:hypothetical protein